MVDKLTPGLTDEEEKALRDVEALVDAALAKDGFADLPPSDMSSTGLPSHFTERAEAALLLMYRDAGYEVLPNHVAGRFTRIQKPVPHVKKTL